jgi:hypothetical protein
MRAWSNCQALRKNKRTGHPVIARPPGGRGNPSAERDRRASLAKTDKGSQRFAREDG